jgi:hypothetical protein
MSKKNRGKGLINIPYRGRGTCPICGTTRIKLLYPVLLPNGESVNVCKRCKKKKIKAA